MTNPESGTPRRFEDLAAERAVLGAIVGNNNVLSDVAENVTAEDFSHSGHAKIFAAMVALDLREQQVDPLTLAEELRERGHLGVAGGVTYLAQLDESVPFGHNATEYAKIIKDRAVRRALAEVGRQIQQLASQETGRIEELLDDAERRVFNIAEKKRVGDLTAMSALVVPAMDLLDKMKKSGSGITGLSTGFIDLDEKLTGLHPGELIILAARPGGGKTSLAMNIALNAASKEGKAVGVFSLEMPSVQLVTRLLATAARVDMKKLRGGRVSTHDMERISEAANLLHGLKLFVDDSGALSSFDLRAKARRLKAKEPTLGLIVIDYLQLMNQKSKVESRQLEVSEISRALKQLAKELNLPVIALSQLNRKVEERSDKRPFLSDLRESGAIEQDADVVMFIHFDDKDASPEGGEPSMRPIPMEVIVAKQRNGPIGSVDLLFLSQYTRFESLARHS